MSRQFGPMLMSLGATSVLASTPVIAQERITESVCPDNTPVVFHQCALEAAQAFDPPRTPDGQPDMGGVWNLPGTAFEDIEEHPEALDDGGGPTTIVDPSDGRVPMRAWSDSRRQENNQAHIHPSAACLLSGMPYTMYRPGPYQFLQTPEHFVVLASRTHAYRAIPLDETLPVGDSIQLWNGASNGRWEGNTLIIETANLNALPWIDQRGRFYTEEVRVVERLTLIETDTIHYQVTVEDLNVFTRPFTIALAYRRNTVDGFELIVEACYENNDTLVDIYRAAGFTLYPGITAEEAREATEADQ